eukprot:3124896-Alexandrium_andersonii.AAC.1
MQYRFKCSELELHGPQTSSEAGPRSSQGMLSTPPSTQILRLPAKTRIKRIRWHDIASIASSTQ